MLRVLVIAVLGLVFGGAVAYVLVAVGGLATSRLAASSPMQADAVSATAANVEATAVEPVAAVVGAPGSLSGKIDALAHLYQSSPAAAWEYLASHPPAVRSELLKELARLWTREDPDSALTQADTILEPALRTEWLANVLAQWAHRDARALLAHVTALAPDALPAAVAALEIAADTDAHAVLSLAERLPTREQRQVRAAAVAAIAATDPNAARAVAAERASHDNERSALERTIARAYASADLDAALAWARSLSPRSTAMLSEVAMFLAERDFDQAAALLIDEASAGRPLEAGTALRGVIGRIGSERILVLSDVLAGLRNAGAKSSLADLVWTWSYYDADAALAWAVDRGDAGMLSTAAIYAGDVSAAFALLERVPEAQRAALVAAAANGHAFEDLPQALAALERFRGSPHYEEAAKPVLSQAISRNPAFAAQLLDTAEASLVAEHAPGAARAWAAREPREALRWALGLADADVRAIAVGGAVAEWAARDPRAAGDWVSALPAGPLRDHAIATTIINAEANGLAYDRQLLDRLSSDDARDRALSAAATLPRLLRERQALIANAAPGVAGEADVYVGTLPWGPP